MQTSLQDDEMRNDPKNYIGGLLYFNHHDKRVILPKRNRYLGWTFNFAHPYTYLIFAITLIVLVILDKLLF
jgi:uncharacterized membrane protein